MQSGGADAMQVCNQQDPPALQSKLQERRDRDARADEVDRGTPSCVLEPV
jgi:hypothetical protein